MPLPIRALALAGLSTVVLSNAASALPFPRVPRAVAENQLTCFMHPSTGSSFNLESLCRRVVVQQDNFESTGASASGNTSNMSSSGGGGKVCDDFSTQQEAQAALAANPGLDGNDDGVACESLP